VYRTIKIGLVARGNDRARMQAIAKEMASRSQFSCVEISWLFPETRPFPSKAQFKRAIKSVDMVVIGMSPDGVQLPWRSERAYTEALAIMEMAVLNVLFPNGNHTSEMEATL